MLTPPDSDAIVGDVIAAAPRSPRPALRMGGAGAAPDLPRPPSPRSWSWSLGLAALAGSRVMGRGARVSGHRFVHDGPMARAGLGIAGHRATGRISPTPPTTMAPC